MDTSNVKIKVLNKTNESIGEIVERSSKERLDNLKQKYAVFKKSSKEGNGGN
jgi:hypothetical protein